MSEFSISDRLEDLELTVDTWSTLRRLVARCKLKRSGFFGGRGLFLDDGLESTFEREKII